MEVLTTVGGAILSAAFQALFDKLGSHDLLTYAREGQVIDDLKKWETILNEIYLVLDDAEEKQMANPSVKTWVSDLRNLAYDVEDILDEFSTEVTRRKMEGEPIQEASTSKVKKLIPTCCGRLSFNTVKFNAQMISMVKEITARFDDIMKRKDLLRLVESSSGRGRNQKRERLSTRETTSLVVEAHVHGREIDKEAILEILKAVETEANFSVVPIVGMGGVGKTTLAQLIFHDTKLEGFDFKSWVSVGEDFDVFRMTNTILQPESSDAKDLNSLQLKLREKLSRKKFLIVLDDVWTESYEDWTLFCSPFTMGAPGSTLVITTRSQHVSSMMSTISAYPLKELSNDDCMSVFAQHALGATDFGEHMDLKEMGMRIVNKCKGLPLAAKALGGLLRGKLNPSVWEEVLISEIWDLPEDKSNVLPALRLSYFHLPSHLKQCFAYCAIFPKDYEFDKNELVLLWMAEGFLSQPKKKPMQDLGCQYFDDLLFRSFFQRSNSNKSRYVMHDLMNDLARYVSKEICFQLDDKFEDENSGAKIRHSSFIRHEYEIWQKFEGFSSINSLRTFLSLPIMSHLFGNYLSSKVLHDLVPKLKCLRVLSVAGYDNILELPSSIGALKHLRYLNLSGTKIKRLPESVGALLNLQTLLLCNCWELEELFSGIGNLINLQCLDISGTDELKEMPLQIGNLRNLHTLTKFIVGRQNGLKLNELKKFSLLQGSLRITGLQNVMDIRDADFANLKEKQGLEELDLEWGDDDSNGSRNPSTEVKVLNSLRPHQNVSRLSVGSFGGTEFPSWIADPSFTNMVLLRLWNCKNVSSLPPLGRLPSLKDLEIKGMNGVKEVGAEFYGDGSSFSCLERLSFYNMLGWEQWCNDLNDVDGEAAKKFPKLCKLYVRNCPKLVGKLPSCSCVPSLRELSICECQKGVLRSAFDLTSLTTLEISSISGLVSLYEAHIEKMVALRDLTIGDCEELKYLWKDGTNLDKLACLKLLKVFDCNQLVSLVEGEEGQLPCNLQVLGISGCYNLMKLPNGLHSLASLRDLEISSCRKLLSFPATGVPYGLRNLYIVGCNSLESLPEGIIMHQANDNGHNKSQLDVLKIFGCESLRSSPNGEFPDSLQTLEIESCNWPTQLFESLCNGFSHLSGLVIGSCPQLNMFPIHTLTSLTIRRCNNLSSLPNKMQNLTNLFIHGCKDLKSLPNSMQNLTFLRIFSCENLRSLPNPMQNFTALKSIKITNCGGIESFPEGGLPPNLTHLYIDDCKNLKQPMSEWGLHRLTCLAHFTISGTVPSIDMFDSFPDNEGLLLPTSVSKINLEGLYNLKSISRGLLKLTSLQYLSMRDCPNLQSFPEEGFPATLEKLNIFDCPLLKERYSKDQKGSYWPFISHIPYIVIDELT